MGYFNYPDTSWDTAISVAAEDSPMQGFLSKTVFFINMFHFQRITGYYSKQTYLT